MDVRSAPGGSRLLPHGEVGLDVRLESMKSLIGLLLGFGLGAACRWLEIPVPSPPKLLGALLVVATTIGYMTVDRYLDKPVAPKPPIATAVR
jgi:XapX domain-containing protein